MNIKLEVIRINEDVIATSIVKKGTFTGRCAKFTDDGNTSNVLDGADHVIHYDNGSFWGYHYLNDGTAYYQGLFNNAGTTIEFGKYYATHYDGVKYYYYECDEGHNHADK